MKKIQFVLLTAGLVALAAACEKQPAASEPEAGERVTTISASIEGAGTKVAIADADGKFSWSAGDKIAVWGTGRGYVMSDALTASGTSADFAFTDYTLYDEERANYAVYPVEIKDDGYYTASDLRIKMPSGYKITDLDDTEYAPVPMIAVNTAGAGLSFKHLGALIRVTVKEVPPTTKSLRVTFEKKVTGSFAVNLTDPANPYIETADGNLSNTVITFDLPSPLTAMRDVVLNIPVPTGNVGAFYVEAYNEGDLLMRTRQTSGVTMARKQGRKAMASLPTFSVNTTTKVVFAPGNLQAVTLNNGADWYWDFEYSQYAFVGGGDGNETINGNGTLSSTSGTVDLFGWSTAATYYGINNSTKSGDDYSGSFKDWGELPIGPYAANTWRSLSTSDWNHLLYNRSASKVGETDNARYVKAKVVDKAGIILFPDQYTHPSGVGLPAGINDPASSFNATQYSADSWEKMELDGCVFLPAAGYRYATTLTNVGSQGEYWTANSDGTKNAYRVSITDGGFGYSSNIRAEGRSVRLARTVSY